jgi:hypothetical protein
VQNNNPGYQTGATLHWYADAGNSQGAALPAAPSLSTANAGRQFFWVSQEAGGCESDAIRVRVWVRERSRAVLDLPTACSGTQVNLARHVSDLNGLATGYEFWDDVPGIGTLLGTVSATNGVVPANQNLFVTLASQTTTYYAVPLNPYNCQVAGSDQLSVASSTLDPVSNITVTNGDPVQVTFNTTASQVVWYNLNNPSIGLIGAAGSGNISFTAQNSGSTPLTANLFAIAYDGGCASQTQNFSITVNPGGANRQAQGDYLSLQAHRINAHDVQLRWSIRYQQPLSHFVVEKWQGQGPLPEDYLILNQESNWKVLGEVEAIGLEGSYAFTDPSGMRNQNYYRVRLVMPDGRLTWSEVVQVNMEYFQSDRFEVFPNPTKDVVQLRCKLEQFHGWSLQLSDQLGRIIRQQPIREQTSRISLREFAPGVYYLKIEGPEGKILPEEGGQAVMLKKRIIKKVASLEAAFFFFPSSQDRGHSSWAGVHSHHFSISEKKRGHFHSQFHAQLPSRRPLFHFSSLSTHHEVPSTSEPWALFLLAHFRIISHQPAASPLPRQTDGQRQQQRHLLGHCLSDRSKGN